MKYGSKYVSLKEDDPYTVTHERALEVIRLKQEADANRLILDFPDDGIQVLNGRYGPYITDKKKNAKIPKDRDPEDPDAGGMQSPHRGGAGARRRPVRALREEERARRQRPRPVQRRPLRAARARGRRRKRRTEPARLRTASRRPKVETARLRVQKARHGCESAGARAGKSSAKGAAIAAPTRRATVPA